MRTQRRRVNLDLTDQELKPRFIDGRELTNWRDGPEMTDYFKLLKNEGWRLTAGDTSGKQLVFERQVA